MSATTLKREPPRMPDSSNELFAEFDICRKSKIDCRYELGFSQGGIP